MTSLEMIREGRKVPAKKGMVCCVNGRRGIITGARNGYIMVRFDGRSFSVPCHPAWRVTYVLPDGTRQAFGFDD